MNTGDGSSQAEKSELLAKGKAEAFRRKLDSSSQLKALAHNPLLLAIMCLIFEQGGELPKRQVDVYEAYIENWLMRWRKTGRPALDADVQLGLLEYLAFNFLEVEKQEFTERELLAATRAFLKLSETDPLVTGIVSEILRTSGLLVEQETGRFRFLHLTFQEYLAARRLRDIWKLTKDISPYSYYQSRQGQHYSPWLNTIFFMSELIPDPEELLRQLLAIVTAVESQGNSVLSVVMLHNYLAGIYKNDNCWKLLMQILENPHPSERYSAVIAFEYGLSQDYRYPVSNSLLPSVGQALLRAAALETDNYVMRALLRVIEDKLLTGLQSVVWELALDMLADSDLLVRLYAAAKVIELDWQSRMIRYHPAGPQLISWLVLGSHQSSPPTISTACGKRLQELLSYRFGKRPERRWQPPPKIPEVKDLRRLLLQAWREGNPDAQQIATPPIRLFSHERLLPDAVAVLGSADLQARLDFVHAIKGSKLKEELSEYLEALGVLRDLRSLLDSVTEEIPSRVIEIVCCVE